MAIEADQIPIMKAVIRGSYSPVLRRAIANSLLLGIEQLRLDNYIGRMQEFHVELQGYRGHKACKEILARIIGTRDALITELMKQYGIDKDLDAFDLYYHELLLHFEDHIRLIQHLVFDNNFEGLVKISQEMSEHANH